VTWCEKGKHEYKKAGRGRPGKNCPEHRESLKDGALAPKTEAKATKMAPCVTCGAEVEVGIKAKLKHVKCPEHSLDSKQKARGRRNALDPFELGISPEDATARGAGAVVTLKRNVAGQEWTEEITLTSIKSVEIGVACFAVAGGSLQKFDPHREGGQYRHFLLSEVVGIR